MQFVLLIDIIDKYIYLYIIIYELRQIKLNNYLKLKKMWGKISQYETIVKN